MPIVVKCPHCDKKIEAPDKLAGRRIKCPSCDEKLRVPQEAQEEPLTVAPLDQEEERERQRMISDSLRLNQFISEQTAEDPVPELN